MAAEGCWCRETIKQYCAVRVALDCGVVPSLPANPMRILYHTQRKRAGCCGVSFTRLCCGVILYSRTDELSRQSSIPCRVDVRDAKRYLFPLGTFRHVMSCQGENQIRI